MSIISGITPFVPSNTGSTDGGNNTAPTEETPPPSDTSSSGDSGTSTDQSGTGTYSGGGTGGDGDTSGSLSPPPSQTTSPPANAAPKSVIAAQAQSDPASVSRSEYTARRAAIAAVETARIERLVEGLRTPVQAHFLTGDLPDVEPPDPLPTADVLIRSKSST